jgi:poly(3-hydroxyalkanoate) synthetase
MTAMARTVHLRTPVTRPEVLERRQRSADLLRPHIGKYVARKNETILIAADTPADVFRWLREHNEHDAVVFMVPVDPITATSVA